MTNLEKAMNPTEDEAIAYLEHIVFPQDFSASTIRSIAVNKMCISAIRERIERNSAAGQNAGDGWISVKDRLPKKEQPVLIYCKNGALFVAEYKGTDYELRKIWNVKGPLGTGRRVASARVTHWMPLPEPPKGHTP